MRRLATTFALLLSAAPGLAQPVVHHPGAWSPYRWWGRDSANSTISVNLYLLRGDSAAHSYVMSHAYDGEPNDTIPRGTLWKWNPATEDCAAAMTANFTLIPMGSLPFNPHSAGGSVLADGNVLAAGGDEHRSTGLAYAAVFDRTTRTWSMTDSMEQRRFDPATLVLADGRVLVGAGSQYFAVTTFGGTRDGAVEDSIRRIPWSAIGPWAPPIVVNGPWPAARSEHAIGVGPTYGPRLMFGGRAAGGTLLGDTWSLLRDDDDFAEDYRWTALAPLGAPPPRARHAMALVNGPSASTPLLWLHGGLGAGDVPLADLWRLRFELGAWRWISLTPDSVDGPPPAARAGHAAVPAEASRAVALFGGREAGSVLSDSLWVLSLAQPRPRWRRPLLLPGPRPSARHLHAMTHDPQLRLRPDGKVWSRAFLFGGETSGGPVADLWTLWISGTGDTAEWVPMVPGGVPPAPRVRATLSYHDVQNRLIVIGGDTTPPGDAPAWSVLVGGPLLWKPLAAGGPALAGHVAFAEPLSYNALVPELWNPVTGQWSALTAAPRLQNLLPFMFVDTTGRVFEAGPTTGAYKTWRLDPALPLWNQVPADTTRLDGGAAVMFRPGHVMKSGNRFVYGAAQPDARWIDLSAPTWHPTVNDMFTGRTNHCLTMFPNGLVLATGGTHTATDAEPVRQPELWDPDWPGAGGRRGLWFGATGVPKLAIDPMVRNYHSTALLLPDARVLSTGGQNFPQSTTGNVYCPPYLFNADGSLAARPPLLSAPETVAWGETFVIEAPDSIAAAVLIRPGSVQHGVNQDQRWISLQRVGGAAPTPHYQAPAHGGIAPPGDYMLFVLNVAGVPSIARWVTVGTIPGASVGSGRGEPGWHIVALSPNPFRDRLTVRVALARPGSLAAQVFDLAGRRVRAFAGGVRSAGTHELAWDGRDARGIRVAAGVYFVRVAAAGHAEHRRVVRID